MATVTYEVVGRTLIMSHGLTLLVGERVGLESRNPEHASIIKRGWVRERPASFSVSDPKTSALTTPPNKQVRRKQTRRKRKS